jgi:hypothetical protein
LLCTLSTASLTYSVHTLWYFQSKEKSARLLYCFIVVRVGVHCGIYKNSYNVSNISYLNSLSLPFSFISSHPIPGTFSTGTIFHLHTCLHSICTIFTLPSPFPHLPPLTGTNLHPPRQNLFCLPVLQFCIRKEEINDIFGFLRLLHREFPYGTSMFICIIVQFGSSPLFFFFLPWSLSYGGFIWFKNSIFIFV